MITELSGLVKFSSADASFVVIETHGVGYEVYVSSLTRAALPFSGGAEVVTLKIKTIASENTLTLYGFATQAEYNAFILLTSVPRVGPRLALKLLSINLEVLFTAIVSGKPEIMLEVKGVGETSVKRIIHELGEKKAPAFLLFLQTSTAQRPISPKFTTLTKHKEGHPETQVRLEDMFRAKHTAGSATPSVPGGAPAAPVAPPPELDELLSEVAE